MSNEVDQTKNEVVPKDITDTVGKRIKELEKDGFQVPANYSVTNALKSAYLAIGSVKASKGLYMEVYKNDKEAQKSVASALLNMVIQGLTPAKTQVYFVAYGNQLNMQRSYFGTQAVVKRLSEVKDIWAEVIHKDDEFEIGSKDGRVVISEFKPKFENLDKPIVGVFAVIEKIDSEMVYTVMTKKQVDMSWSQGHTQSVQSKFPEEMAKRTVLNRAAKSFINTSDDSDLLTQAINETTQGEYDNSRDTKDVTPSSADAKAANLIETLAPKEPKPVTAPVETPDTPEPVPEPQNAPIPEPEPENSSEEAATDERSIAEQATAQMDFFNGANTK